MNLIPNYNILTITADPDSTGPAFTQTTVAPQTAVVEELPAALYWLN